MNILQQNDFAYGQEMTQVNMMNMVPQHTNMSFQQANITIISPKIKAGDKCCVIATMLTVAFCVFPFFWLHVVEGKNISDVLAHNRSLPRHYSLYTKNANNE